MKLLLLSTNEVGISFFFFIWPLKKWTWWTSSQGVDRGNLAKQDWVIDKHIIYYLDVFIYINYDVWYLLFLPSFYLFPEVFLLRYFFKKTFVSSVFSPLISLYFWQVESIYWFGDMAQAWVIYVPVPTVKLWKIAESILGTLIILVILLEWKANVIV
jgi:hypothetical protein